jgi:RNA polymerase sigma-70 factor (ECF subfamily)
VIAVLEDRAAPSRATSCGWNGEGQISFIRDYKYVRYVTTDAEVTLAP